mmetsp:Transcript_8333/g.12298  ORF Transcript_8333/g.12298 Transcript_8333/m.12298 type:complete len:236 (-) Transcript_8333:228-935(-)
MACVLIFTFFKNPAELISSGFPFLLFQLRSSLSISRSTSGYSSFSTRYFAKYLLKAFVTSERWHDPPWFTIRRLSANSSNSFAKVSSLSESSRDCCFSPDATLPSSRDAPAMRLTPASWSTTVDSPSAARRRARSVITPKIKNTAPISNENAAGNGVKRPSFLSLSQAPLFVFVSYKRLPKGRTSGLLLEPDKSHRAAPHAALPMKSFLFFSVNGFLMISSLVCFVRDFWTAIRS